MMKRIITETADILEGTAKRLRALARNEHKRKDLELGMEAANELRSLFANIRLDLLVKYGSD